MTKTKLAKLVEMMETVEGLQDEVDALSSKLRRILRAPADVLEHLEEASDALESAVEELEEMTDEIQKEVAQTQTPSFDAIKKAVSDDSLREAAEQAERDFDARVNMSIPVIRDSRD